MLVAIEGLDFSGKTTLCNMLSKGIEVELPDQSLIIKEARQRVYNLGDMCKDYERSEDVIRNHYYRNCAILDTYMDHTYRDCTWNHETIAVADRWKGSMLIYGLAMHPERAIEIMSDYRYLDIQEIPLLEVVLDISREEWDKRTFGKELDAYEKFVSGRFDLMRGNYLGYVNYYDSCSESEVCAITVDGLTKEQVYNAVVAKIWSHQCMKDVDTVPVML